MTQFQLCSIETKTSENANNRKRKSPAAGSETRSNGTSADATKEMLCVPKPRQDEGSSDISQRSEEPRAAAATTWQKYQCPYCQASTESTIKNGKVNVAGHCGKQFRVSNGQVARGNTHACPLCGTKVQSARAYTAKSNATTRNPMEKLAPPRDGTWSDDVADLDAAFTAKKSLLTSLESLEISHSKERDTKRLPPAKKTWVSKSDLGRPLAKASNSSRIRAQAMQNHSRNTRKDCLQQRKP